MAMLRAKASVANPPRTLRRHVSVLKGTTVDASPLRGADTVRIVRFLTFIVPHL
jgi:hypothetical protein